LKAFRPNLFDSSFTHMPPSPSDDASLLSGRSGVVRYPGSPEWYLMTSSIIPSSSGKPGMGERSFFPKRSFAVHLAGLLCMCQHHLFIIQRIHNAIIASKRSPSP